MKKIIAFAGSNSSTSINKKLATYAASKMSDVDIEVLDLNDYDLPLYGPDLETSAGIPDDAQKFYKKIASANGIILSLAEYNGSYTTAFKNLLDWITRIDKEAWQKKPMLLMSTSPGGRGGAGVLGAAKNAFPHLGGDIVADFSLPSFEKNFAQGRLVDVDLSNSLTEKVKLLQDPLS